MLQTLTFNGARVINAEASFFRYESGSAAGADESVKLRADGQDLGMFYPGDSVELPDRRVMWEIMPTSAACAGTVRLGVGRVQSARLVGTVRVLDSNKDRTIAGQAFAAPIQRTAVPGFLSTVELFNPASSGKNVLVSNVTVFSSAAQEIRVGTYNGFVGVSNGANASKKAGGALSSSISYLDGTLTGPPGGFGYLYQFATQALVTFSMSQKEPIVLPPGYGLIVQGAAVNTGVTANFEFIEEPI